MGELKVLKTRREIDKEAMLALLDDAKKMVRAGELESLALVGIYTDGATYRSHSVCEFASMIGAAHILAAALAKEAIEGEG